MLITTVAYLDREFAFPIIDIEGPLADQVEGLSLSVLQ